MPASLRFEHASRTDVGHVRAVNEDAHLARGQDALWAVADGMGGHARGQWASATIVAALDTIALPDDLEGALAVTRAALGRVNAAIWRTGASDHQVIGSTVTVLLVREDRYAVLWAGDSRLYRLRGGVLELLTADHSHVEQMVARGLLTRDEAEDHPMAHILSRAVGARPDLTLDERSGVVLPGDMFLLCSDGLSRTIDDAEIGSLLDQATPRRVAALLVDAALARGASDNVTVIVVGCDETTQLAFD